MSSNNESRINLDSVSDNESNVNNQNFTDNSNSINEDEFKNNTLETKMQELQEKIKQMESDSNDTKQKFLLAIADRENSIKRLENEKKDAVLFANQNLLKSLTEPLEQLFLALTNKPVETSEADYKNMYTGVEMTKNEFIKILSNLGLKRIYPLNEPFNPNFHQAISIVEDIELQSGSIKNVVQAGYELNGRLIKPALVIVVK